MGVCLLTRGIVERRTAGAARAGVVFGLPAITAARFLAVTAARFLAVTAAGLLAVAALTFLGLPLAAA